MKCKRAIMMPMIILASIFFAANLHAQKDDAKDDLEKAADKSIDSVSVPVPGDPQRVGSDDPSNGKSLGRDGSSRVRQVNTAPAQRAKALRKALVKQEKELKKAIAREEKAIKKAAEKEKASMEQGNFHRAKERISTGLKDWEPAGPPKPGASPPSLNLKTSAQEAGVKAEIVAAKSGITQRLEESNSYARAIYRSLKTKVPPPLPPRKFDQMQPGDVILINRDLIGSEINFYDRLLSGTSASQASHTVIYLKTVNGRKLFLENLPGEGPCIITEDVFEKRYDSRGGSVAKLAQPLNEKEGRDLWDAAVAMAQKNNREVAENWGKKPHFGTNYGIWGSGDLVCSESDWALLRATGRNIPKTDDWIKGLAVDFSPADFFTAVNEKNERIFLISPLFPPIEETLELK